MCTGLEVLAAVGSIAGTAVSFVGQMQAADAVKSSSEYNAAMMEREAQDAIARTDEEEDDYTRESQQRRAEVEARMAGNGIDISRGSAGSLLADYAEIEQMDKDRIRESGAREAQYKLDQAAMTRAEGKNAAIAGAYGAAGSLLSGASTVASRWASRPSSSPPRRRDPNGNFL